MGWSPELRHLETTPAFLGALRSAEFGVERERVAEVEL
jgi:hypothetical protein